MQTQAISDKDHEKNKCPVGIKCICLVTAKIEFFRCCGWYCLICDGKVVDVRKDRVLPA